MPNVNGVKNNNMAKKKLKVDVTVKCAGFNKMYMSALHAEENCCYEPVHEFKKVDANPKDSSSYSLPWLGFTFKKGKTYRIRAEEI